MPAGRRSGVLQLLDTVVAALVTVVAFRVVLWVIESWV